MNKNIINAAIIFCIALAIQGCTYCNGAQKYKGDMKAKESLPTNKTGKNYIYCNQCLPNRNTECRVNFTK